MIYLYKKTHQITGLKYLGKTTRDPYEYQGSGKYWSRHIDKHGYLVETQILLESEDPEEIKKMGIYYSDLWNVVESYDWANLKPESGDGGTFKHTDEAKKKISDAGRRDSPLKGMTYEEIQGDTESAKIRKENHSDWMSLNQPNKGRKYSDKTKKQMSESRYSMLEKLTDEERKALLGSCKNKPWSVARRLAQDKRKKEKQK